MKLHNKRIERKKFKRQDVLTIISACFFVIIAFRLFNIQVIRHADFIALASDQQKIYEQLVPERGKVYIEDRFTKNLYPLAINKRLNLVYAIPKQITEPDKTATELEKILEIPKEDLMARLTKENDLYEPIKHRVTDEKVEEIKSHDFPGVRFQPEDWRYYPDNEFASHILGFVGYVGDEKRGRYGVEGYYNDVLSGKAGYLAIDRDPTGRLISLGSDLFDRAVDGDDLVLTIDRYIQFKTEQKLKSAVERFGAEKGTVIIMNPKNGEIIAMANYPNFNLNEYGAVEDAGVFSNSAIYDSYEPGSAFKPIIMASAIDMGLVSPDTELLDNGAIEVDKFTIRNFDGGANGMVTMTEILEKSINVGMVQIAQKMTRPSVFEYINKFGFNDLSGIDMDAEVPIKLSNYTEWSDATLATISFGQGGMSTTPMRLVTATAAIANGGKLIQPRIVKKIMHSNGDEDVIGTKDAGRVLSPSTAATTAAMMVSVVEKGFGSPAKVKGYKIAGKTGTAQVPNEGKAGYDPGKKITSFIGFGPVEDPQFVMLVKLNNPGGDVWGSTTAAPVFKEIAEELLRYYQIPPSE